jgi:uncharacterized repeat protein (TIGR03803 family)
MESGADGSGPSAGVIGDSAGNLYGTTEYGGTANAGVVFKVDTSLVQRPVARLPDSIVVFAQHNYRDSDFSRAARFIYSRM